MRSRPYLKKLLFAGRLSLSCVILVYLITFIDFERFTFLATHLQPVYVLGACLLLLLVHLVVAIRWSLLLQHFGIRQSIMDSWRYYMISSFYSIVLPGVIGGDVVRLGLCVKSNGHAKPLPTIGSILFERTCGITALMLMATAAAMLAPMLLDGETALANIIPWLALSGILSLSLFFLILKSVPAEWFKKADLTVGWTQKLTLLLGQFRSLPMGALVLILLLSLFAHFVDIVGCYLLSMALHFNQPLYVFLFIMPIVYVATMLPISVGGIGVREGILTFFLVKVGVTPSDAVLLALAIYLNRVFVGLIGGVLQLKIKDKENLK